MRASPPFLASVLVGFCVITLGQAEETKNPDGTYTSTTTISDVNLDKAKNSDPAGTGNNHTTQNSHASSAESAKMFPDDAVKKAKKEEDRAKMTKEQLEHEKKMLDRTPASAGVKVNNPNLTETNSIPKRN